MKFFRKKRENRDTDKTYQPNLLKTLIDFARVMKIKPLFFISQIASSLVIAFFEGLSLALLVPLAKGVIEKDFSFMGNYPVFNKFFALYPHLLERENDTYLFLLLILTIFISAVIKNVLDYLFMVYVIYQKEDYRLNLKKHLFKRYLSFGKLYFDRTSQGYVDQLLIFVDEIAKIFEVMGEVAVSLSIVIGYLVIMFSVSWEMTMFSLIIFPTLWIALKWVVKKIKKTGQRHAEVCLRLGQEVFNILSCILLVKAYDKEEEAKNKFEYYNEELKNLNISLDKKNRLFNPLQEIIMLTGLLLLISAVAFRFVKSQAGEAAGYLIFFVLARKSVPYFSTLNVFRGYLARAVGPIKEIEKVMDDKDKFFIESGDLNLAKFQDKIEFNNLTFSYFQGIKVLKNLSLQIKKGKVTAIVGPTGSGKTTLISLIMRFYEVPAGTIFIDGTDIKRFSLKSLKKHMAFVSQETFLFHDSLRNNIVYGLDGKVDEDELSNVIKKARLENFVQKLPQALETPVGDRGVKLSGGEKQRVSIARALLKNSEILFLDEATSSLDTHTERLIQEAIEEAVKGRTTIVIAHRLSTIKNADWIIVLEEGSLVEQGKLKELLDRKGIFFRYWEEQKFY
ncbi:MAG: ABC transporter ATP-binding protein [Candidatus Omnitrophica bacterium]|nr:ABC transporter ATP-binding protein [Candidatus Omnitrophota bacterium]